MKRGIVHLVFVFHSGFLKLVSVIKITGTFGGHAILEIFVGEEGRLDKQARPLGLNFKSIA